MRLDGIGNDLRFALRGLLRERAFTLTAVAMLALAIGLNVTTFAVWNTMVNGGFPLVERNDRLLYMQESGPGRGCCISYANFEDWRAQARSFEDLAFVSGRELKLRDGADAGVRMHAVPVTANAFGLLGVAPALGRDFVAADETPGAPRVAILSHAFWASRFGARADIVGHTLYLDDTPTTVIGVMPERFAFPAAESLWVPLERTPALLSRNLSSYLAFGRLADGVSPEQARTEIRAIGDRLALAYPDTNRDLVTRIGTHAEFFMGPDAVTVYGSVWAAGWFVLLIACANLANLALARAARRTLELSTRLALGAGHWRMARQVVVEALLLAAAGGTLGWWIAKWSVRVWAAATESQYQILDYTIGIGTLAYTFVVALAAAALFGAVPVLKLRRLSVSTLKGGARGVTQGRAGKQLAAALVAVQMALAIVLLSGAGVLARSFSNVVGADVGVRAPENVLIGWVAVPDEKYASADARNAFFDRLRAQLASVVGVESQSIANAPPVNITAPRRFDLEGAVDSTVWDVTTIVSGPDYLAAVGGTTLAGRDFDDTDLPASQPVALVNRSFTERYWPGEDALGKRLRLYDRDEPGEWLTVVGVASNIMQGDPVRQTFLPIVYTPFRQAPAPRALFFARARGPAEPLAAAVRAAVEQLDPELTLEQLSTLEQSFAFRADRMDIEHVEMGKHAALAPIFAGLALLLAAVGLYAVVAHSVDQRTKEIGIRMAIGAALRDIRRLVFREGLRPVAIGLAAGLGASLGVNRLLQSQLVGVSPYDPVTLAIATLVLLCVALLGCHFPARRAMRADPMIALRHD